MKTIIEFNFAFWQCPSPWALPIIKHETTFIMNQTYVDQETYEWESSYAYSSIVGRFLHLIVGLISLPISRREIHDIRCFAQTLNFL
jgi:hypothetical protein